MKYLWRHRRKGGAEDLEKAKWYIDRMIETERELLAPLDEAAEWYKKGGLFTATRGSHKKASMEELARSNPAIWLAMCDQTPEAKK